MLLQIISLKDLLRPDSKDTFDDIYLASELLDTDLHQYVGDVSVWASGRVCVRLYTVRTRVYGFDATI